MNGRGTCEQIDNDENENNNACSKAVHKNGRLKKSQLHLLTSLLYVLQNDAHP